MTARSHYNAENRETLTGIFAPVYLPPLGWLQEGDFQWRCFGRSTHSIPALDSAYKEWLFRALNPTAIKVLKCTSCVLSAHANIVRGWVRWRLTSSESTGKTLRSLFEHMFSGNNDKTMLCLPVSVFANIVLTVLSQEWPWAWIHEVAYGTTRQVRLGQLAGDPGIVLMEAKESKWKCLKFGFTF